MAALTGTKVIGTQFAKKVAVVVTCVPSTASDTVTLTQATHGLSAIDAVFASVREGQDNLLQSAHATFSGLVITVKTKAGDGTDASDWTGAVIQLLVIGDA